MGVEFFQHGLYAGFDKFWFVHRIDIETGYYVLGEHQFCKLFGQARVFVLLREHRNSRNAEYCNEQVYLFHWSVIYCNSKGINADTSLP